MASVLASHRSERAGWISAALDNPGIRSFGLAAVKPGEPQPRLIPSDGNEQRSQSARRKPCSAVGEVVEPVARLLHRREPGPYRCPSREGPPSSTADRPALMSQVNCVVVMPTVRLSRKPSRPSRSFSSPEVCRTISSTRLSARDSRSGIGQRHLP